MKAREVGPAMSDARTILTGRSLLFEEVLRLSGIKVLYCSSWHGEEDPQGRPTRFCFSESVTFFSKTMYAFSWRIAFKSNSVHADASRGDENMIPLAISRKTGGHPSGTWVRWATTQGKQALSRRKRESLSLRQLA